MVKTKKEGRFICRCECGGKVRGFEDFGRTWTWCESCTPVIKIKAQKMIDGLKKRSKQHGRRNKR